MILKSYSKINLTLRVNDKLKNNLHNIQSYFCLINLCDEIRIKKIFKKTKRKDEIKFFGRFSKNIDNLNNTVSSTLRLLRKKKLISNYYSIKVKKKIPIFSGLGGGTGNAVSLANFLTKSKNKKGLSDLLDNYIGSDSRLFFYKQGFLKSLKSVKSFKKYDLYFLLIYPRINCSTKFIYSKVKNYSPRQRISLIKFTNKDSFLNFIAKEKNDLQGIVEKKYPKIKKLIKAIKSENGCYISRMTGSGSVCFGVFKSKKSAKVALNRIKLKFPKYWMCVAKTI